MGELTQYGVAAAVTYLLLKEIFAFLSKMREKAISASPLSPCGFTAAQQSVDDKLTDIRDGINELVILSRRERL